MGFSFLRELLYPEIPDTRESREGQIYLKSVEGCGDGLLVICLLRQGKKADYPLAVGLFGIPLYVLASFPYLIPYLVSPDLPTVGTVIAVTGLWDYHRLIPVGAPEETVWLWTF